MLPGFLNMLLQNTYEHNDDSETYSLNPTAEEPYLHCLYSKLEERLPSLFVSESKDCSVEVLGPFAEPSASGTESTSQPEPTQSTHTAGLAKLHVKSPSTLEDLEDILQIDMNLQLTEYADKARAPLKFLEPYEHYAGNVQINLHLRSDCTKISHPQYYLEKDSEPPGIVRRLIRWVCIYEQRLTTLDREVSFPKPLKEFDVDFSFSQQVHVVRKKLSHAHLILDNTLATIDSLRTLANKVTLLIGPPDSIVESFQSKLQDLSGELRNLRQTSRKLLLQSEDINLMNNEILRLRSQSLMYDNGVKLAQLAQSDATEKKIMVMLANNTAEDSRTMRIATMVAMFYLPANLVMTFFSSNLVELKRTRAFQQENEGTTSMHVRQEIWVAVVTILVVAFSTLLPAMYLDRKGKRLNNRISNSTLLP
ncbi:MAG: hypothetical protein Q9186_005574 [Xanthomendoza sp. 1 TL-2023]